MYSAVITYYVGNMLYLLQMLLFRDYVFIFVGDLDTKIEMLLKASTLPVNVNTTFLVLSIYVFLVVSMVSFVSEKSLT